MVVLVATGAPFELRLPIGLLYVFFVPGFATVGMLRPSDPTTEAALSVVSSVAICTAVAQGLAWSGRYSLAGTLAVLTFLTTVGLLLQLRAEPTAPGDGNRRLWPRSFWS